MEVAILDEIIGRGGNAIVFKCWYFGHVCAAKLNNKDVELAESTHEANILRRCNHRNIIRFYDTHAVRGKCGQENDKYEAHHITESSTWKLIRGILSGLQYLHEDQRIIHRDIHPGNVLLTKDNVVKISDFGTACSNTRQRSRTPGHGVKLYRAPEAFNEHLQTPLLDIYSAGASFYEMMIIFRSEKSRIRGKKNGQLVNNGQLGDGRQLSLATTDGVELTDRRMAAHADRLISCMTSREPGERLSASKLLRELDQIEDETTTLINASVAAVKPKHQLANDENHAVVEGLPMDPV